MKLELLKINEFCNDLPEVTNSNMFHRNKPHPDGLFSQQIFGPTNTAVCGCGTYWGRSNIGKTCPKCKVDIAYSSERKKRFAKIKFSIEIINPILYDIVTILGRSLLKNMIDNILEDNEIIGYCYCEEEYTPITDTSEIDFNNLSSNTKIYSGFSSIKKLVKDFAEERKDENPSWNFVLKNLDELFMSDIIVIPPEFRPASSTGDSKKVDRLNRDYRMLINFQQNLQSDHLDLKEIDSVISTSRLKLQDQVFKLYNHLFEQMSKKEGLIRGCILGKRIDFSARSVIAPDPDLKLDECSIPYEIALELYKLDIANRMIEKRLIKRFDKALEMIDTEQKEGTTNISEIVEETIQNQYIMLNRQPSLHRMSVLAFKPKLNFSEVVRLPNLICEPFNADFDGDQMALYRPLGKDAIKECEEKLSVQNNILSPTTSDLIISANQDVVLGLYNLTQTEDGRKELFKAFPKDFNFELLNRVVDKKVLKIVLNYLAKVYNPQEVCDTIDRIKNCGLKYTTLDGNTMSMKDMYLPESEEIAREILDDENLSITEKVNKIKNEAVPQIKENFPYTSFIESGSRGSWDQAMQLVLCRGYISNYSGDIINTPIYNNLSVGLDKKEFFASCYGERKGLLDVAVNTAVSGYLARKLIYANVTLEKDEENTDCGTEDCLLLNISKDDDDFARSLIGRYVYVDNKEIVVTYKNFTELVGKKVKVRSPIFCKNRKICHKCYGKMHDQVHSKYVGTIAAHALGEVSTQLVLRTFHTSGAAQTKENNEETDQESGSTKQQDITNDLTLVNKIFSGKLYDNYFDVLMNLYDVFSNYESILLVHYECIVSQLMRKGENLWRIRDNRDITDYQIVSILSVPKFDSFLLGLAFSNPKKQVIESLLGKHSSSNSILERIMTNSKLED